MTGYDAYITYLAVNRHFDSNYDFFKYNGKIKASEDAYNGRRDRFFFEKASRKFKDDDFVNFLVSNRIKEDKIWIGNLLTGGVDNYNDWKKRLESLTYSFKEDISKICDAEEDFNSIFASKDNQHPLLFRMFMRKMISIETMAILDILVGYSKRLYGKDFILDGLIGRINKYAPFLQNAVNLDKSKFKKIVLDKFA